MQFIEEMCKREQYEIKPLEFSCASHLNSRVRSFLDFNIFYT